MTIPLYCLLGFVAWTLLLVGVVVSWRVRLTLTGERGAGGFHHSGEDAPAWNQRAVRAHQNCVENLPMFAAVVLVGQATGEQSSAMDAAAVIYLVARVLQSGVHLASVGDLAVSVRFTFFLVQHVCLIALGVLIVMAAA